MEPTKIAPDPMLMTNPEFHTGEGVFKYEIDRLFSFEHSRDRLFKLIGGFESERTDTEHRRTIRDIEVDIEAMHRRGDLKADETLIAIRVIDENIRQEQPQYINYLAQSNRILIFKDTADPRSITKDVEDAFTKGMRYDNWIQPFIKAIDGAQLHGWDSVEIEFDVTKPFYVGISHIGHENLIFDRNVKSVEDCEEILRRFDLTLYRFEALKNNPGFNVELINRLTTEYKQQEKTGLIVVYKRFFKFQGTVYTSWFLGERDNNLANDWLKGPEPLVLGDSKEITIRQMMMDPMMGMPIPRVSKEFRTIPETEYPVKLLYYQESEEPKIFNKKGRAFYDQPKQEAQTAFWSVAVNGSIRASQVFGSPKTPSSIGSGIKKLDLTLEGGCFYSEPMEFWRTEYPQESIIRFADALNVRTKQEKGDIAGAVINREDSRKTAREIKFAETEKITLSSIQLIHLSTFVAGVYKPSWRLVRSLALQNIIDNFGVDPMKLQKTYVVSPAGDIDVVMRQEDITKRITVWPLVANVPGLNMQFLADILSKMFPEDAPVYMAAVEAANQQQQMINALLEMLKSAIVDPATGQTRAEFKAFEPQIAALTGGETTGGQKQLTAGTQP